MKDYEMQSELSICIIDCLTNKTNIISPFVHGIVNHGVDTAVGHGQPVEGQEHVRGVPGLHDGGVVEGVHEVSVVGKPANTKYSCHSSKHVHNLKSLNQLTTIFNYKILIIFSYY